MQDTAANRDASPVGRGKPRTGGRSARVQEAVHRAVQTLQREAGADGGELSVPAIAAIAGVAPSTIYRRWGSLAQLLSDVAVQNIRPEAEPENTGSLREDLRAWVAQYLEEMASDLGRSLLRDLVGGSRAHNACQCSVYIGQQFELLRLRAIARGERAPSAQKLMDRIIAPILFRILFSPDSPGLDDALRLIDATLADTAD